MAKQQAPEIIPIVVPDRGVRRWHCGALDTLPFYSADVGGINFPRTTEIVSVDDDTRGTLRTPRPGAFYELTDIEVERVKAAIARKVVRFANPDKLKGFILSVTDQHGTPNPRYRKLAGDEPLGKFLYMREIPADLDIKPGAPLIS